MALKQFRDNLKSLKWVLLIVVAALVWLVFAEWGGGFSQGRAQGGTDIAATVGDQKITYTELREEYKNLQTRYREMFGEQFNSELEEQLGLQRQAFQQAVTRRILMMEAMDAGLQVTDQELSAQIVAYPVFQRDGRFVGLEEYQKILRSNRLKIDEFENSIRAQLLLQKLDRVLAKTAYVPDAEVERVFREQNERAKIRFVELPASEMEAPEPTSEELAAYLAAHPEEFEIPEQRAIDYLLVETDQLRQAMEITPEAIETYYNENVDEFTREEQVRARHILRKITSERSAEQARAEIEAAKERIAAGEDFATLARELSEDDVSARAGGILAPFGRGKMLPPFENAAFSASVGDLVGPIETSFGFHLIEVLSRTEGGLQPLEQVRPVIEARLRNEQAAEEAERKAIDLAGRIKTDMSEEEMRQVAEEEGLELTSTGLFGQNDPVDEKLRLVRSLNLSIFEVAEGAISEPIRIPRGWVIFRLREVAAPRQPELAEAEEKVSEAVIRQQRKARASERLAAARAAGTGLEAVAEEWGLEIRESEEFNRVGNITGLGRNREVIEAALGLDEGALGGPFETDNGAVLFEVLERQRFDPAKFEEEKPALLEQQENERLFQLKASLVEKRRRELDIRPDPSLAASFGAGAQVG